MVDDSVGVTYTTCTYYFDTDLMFINAILNYQTYNIKERNVEQKDIKKLSG